MSTRKSEPTNFTRWLKNIFLLGQESYYLSFSKAYFFLLTHLILLLIINGLVQLVANIRGFTLDSVPIKVAIPTTISYYLFFTAGKNLNERSISILVLAYGYIALIIYAIFNVEKLLKIYLEPNVSKK